MLFRSGRAGTRGGGVARGGCLGVPGGAVRKHEFPRADDGREDVRCDFGGGLRQERVAMPGEVGRTRRSLVRVHSSVGRAADS